ncbi:MAG: crossover junction endodeoxyribonuclease RuvC [Candidatus Taylorbacteria bacterium RIFCSPHIGHO2_01_FULL_46_22b]|uniref:Crossover junction endodeoxyribonuclease RuvC n=1 Tax=Candidatus Taylorbacteria bacterium RIFCSPHIGHO2_01_FULL_46_22b TaxID=1802301 RepID=A0A1G2M4L2_9BACT|nr:MAG: crossover junction endodeoxyribonuclease RuvC [Candidatus Taylorbacteria bacterium RIFCSPHIGHO2_01_FULL_46_22b]
MRNNPSPYRVLGIDPGYGRLGIAVIEKIDGKEKLIFSECFETDSKKEKPERLGEIRVHLDAIIKTYTPSTLAVETLFFSKNKKTALSVAEARGVVTSCASAAGLSVFEYHPSDIKIAVAGYGGADKQQVQTMVQKLLKFAKIVRLDDEYDAIAVALTHLATYRRV